MKRDMQHLANLLAKLGSNKTNFELAFPLRKIINDVKKLTADQLTSITPTFPCFLFSVTLTATGNSHSLSASDWLTGCGPFTLWTNNGGQTFGLFACQTFWFAPLLGCGPPQVIDAGLQEALGRRYFFVDVVGKVAQDAYAVLHRLLK